MSANWSVISALQLQNNFVWIPAGVNCTSATGQQNKSIEWTSISGQWSSNMAIIQVQVHWNSIEEMGLNRSRKWCSALHLDMSSISDPMQHMIIIQLLGPFVSWKLHWWPATDRHSSSAQLLVGTTSHSFLILARSPLVRSLVGICNLQRINCWPVLLCVPQKLMFCRFCVLFELCGARLTGFHPHLSLSSNQQNCTREAASDGQWNIITIPYILDDG